MSDYIQTDWHKIHNPENENICFEILFNLQFSDFNYLPCQCGIEYIKVKSRKCYRCPMCEKQLYPMAGTFLEKTTTPLTYWLVFMIIKKNQENINLSIKDMGIVMGVTYKTAWRIAWKLQEHQYDKLTNDWYDCCIEVLELQNLKVSISKSFRKMKGMDDIERDNMIKKIRNYEGAFKLLEKIEVDFKNNKISEEMYNHSKKIIFKNPESYKKLK